MTFETDLEIMRTRSAHGDNRLDARSSLKKESLWNGLRRMRV
jgi:hypothetical protein